VYEELRRIWDISGSHGDEYEGDSLIGYDTV
jgi:hypothetical protein